MRRSSAAKARFLTQGRPAAVVLHVHQPHVAHGVGAVEGIERRRGVVECCVDGRHGGRRYVTRAAQFGQTFEQGLRLGVPAHAHQDHAQQRRGLRAAFGQRVGAAGGLERELGLVVGQVQARLGQVGNPETGLDLQRTLQPRRRLVAAPAGEQVAGFQGVEDQRHRVELTCPPQVREAFVGPVQGQQQQAQAEVRLDGAPVARDARVTLALLR